MKHLLTALALSCLPFAPLGAAPAAEVKGPPAPQAKPAAKPAAKPEAAPLVRAAAVHGRLAPTLAPTVRQWINQEARKVGADSKTDVTADVRARFAGQSLSPANAETLVVLVLFEAARDAEKDMKTMLEEIKAANAKKKEAAQAPKEARPAAKTRVPAPAVRRDLDRKTVAAAKDQAKDQRDSQSEMGEEASLRLQAAMDRMAKTHAMLSEAMKKASETSGGITQNLK